MEHLPGSANRRASRATVSPNNVSDLNRSLYRSRSVDSPRTPRTAASPRHEFNDPNVLSRSQSSNELASRFVQPERRPVSTSQSLDKIDANTTVERGQTNPPLSHNQSSEGVFPLEASSQSPDSRSSFNSIKGSFNIPSPEQAPLPENKPLEAHIPTELSTSPSIMTESLGVQPTRSTELPNDQPVLPTSFNRPRSTKFISRLPRPTKTRQSSEGVFPLEVPSQSPDSRSSFNSITGSFNIPSPDRTHVLENELPEAHTPSGDNFSSSLKGSPYKRRQPIDQGETSDSRRSRELEVITRVEPSTSNRLETLFGDSINDQALRSELGILKNGSIDWKKFIENAPVLVEVLRNKKDGESILTSFKEKKDQIVQNATTLLGSLGIKNDNLDSGDYLDALDYATTMARVIRTDGPDKEFNDASKELLKLTSQRSRLRSLVNPRKDTIDWYRASWKNQHLMSKLDATTWGGYTSKLFYRANQPLAGIMNTRSGTLSFIALQALAGTAYTSYVGKGFSFPTLLASVENAAVARSLYAYVPNPINQAFDTLQFQGVATGLYKLLHLHDAVNATMGG